MSEEKTEDATPDRIRDARRRGQAPRSQEWTGACSLTLVILTLGWVMQPLCDSLRDSLRIVLGGLHQDPAPQLPLAMIWRCVLALLAASITGSVLAQWMASGWLLTAHPLQPDLNRLNPVQNAQRWFSSKMLVDAVRLAIKVGGSLWLTRNYLEGHLLVDPGTGQTVSMFGTHFWDWLRHLAFFYVLVGGLDLLYQKWEFKRGLRMSKHDIKQEYRQKEGDPHRKGRARALAHKLLKARSLQRVPQASVVITNPTHLAVALEFNFQLGAPRVVAKGADQVALAIRKLARQSGVPIVEDKPLARALFPLEVDDYIPQELFRPVAEILVAVAKAAEERSRAE